jgi:hypothetical protein
MKEKENINLTINGEVKNPIEIVLREGEAIKHQYPKKYVTTGVIGSPVKFSSMVKNKEASVVEVYYIERKIKLFEDPTNTDSAEVVGQITTNPDLMAFGINKDTYFTSTQLIKHVRKYAHCFKTTAEAKALIETLQNFEVKFEQTHKKEDDRKGNSEESVKNAIKYHKGEVKTDLKLSLPLFVGADKVDFDVEIEIDRQGTTPVFGFYSINMETIILEETEKLIDSQVEILEKEFTCIQIN